MASPVYYTLSNYRRFSPYAEPLDLNERTAVRAQQQALHAITLCSTCRANRTINVPRQPNCPRCTLLNRVKSR